MANNMGKVEAFKSYYEQAKKAYTLGQKDNAKQLFLRAASLANEISVSSSSYDVKMEYHNEALKILKFVKNDFDQEFKDYEKSVDGFFPTEVTTSEDRITFADVAGLNDVKEEIIYNVLEPLKNPDLAKSYNIKPGAKILLYGPPGTGKTLIARAIAGEVDAKFYAINCQDLISKYMGESSKQIDKLFEEAQKNKRAVIFFDEFDSMASKRDSDGSSVDGEMARFVASFLTKVDGFKKPKDCEMLLLMAATNRPWAIDPAMLRGGRFDTHIYVGMPDQEARKFLVEKEFKDLTLSGFTTDELASDLIDYAGADIVAICRKIKQIAYRRAIKNNSFEPITKEDATQVIENTQISVTIQQIDRFIDFKEGKFN